MISPEVAFETLMLSGERTAGRLRRLTRPYARFLGEDPEIAYSEALKKAVRLPGFTPEKT